MSGDHWNYLQARFGVFLCKLVETSSRKELLLKKRMPADSP